jgi:predicted metal-dependent HD superfamily phosphohydrolase
MKGYRKLRNMVLHELQGLKPHLTYHGLHHTLDVVNVCNGYIRRLKLPKREAYLLRIAALIHDMGFLVSHVEHEATSAKMAENYLKDLGYGNADIREVQKMIVATKPTNPSNTKLEKILVDADLDYLGRDDFERISNTLFSEFKTLGIVKDYKSWMRLQVKFLEFHEYQTDFAKKYRAPKKAQWLEKIKAEVATF